MNTTTRRRFLGTLLAGGAMAGGCRSPAACDGIARRRSAGSRLNVAVIGAAGRGEACWRAVCASGDRLAALCDVDERALLAARDAVADAQPGLKLYKDFRVLFEVEREIDAVLIATPDHGHAVQAAWAMARGCHVFIEPPLVHTLSEMEALTRKARRHRVALWMGDEPATRPAFRRAVTLLRAGIIGTVTEIHAWTARPVWPQGGHRPEGSDPVPPELDWELWLCGAPPRPFKQRIYHRYNWRGWCDFGGGALGDIGCQLLGLPFRALGLDAPRAVSAAESDEATSEMYPRASRVEAFFDAPARRQPPVTLTWHDGGRQPSAIRLPEVIRSLGALPASGCLLAGEGGVWLMADETGERHRVALTGETRLADAEKHEACTLAPLPPKGADTHTRFLDALRAGKPEPADASHVRALMETVLTGCVAQRVPGRLAWNSRKGRFAGNDDANRLVASACAGGDALLHCR
ncbi:MAG TPA: Gfo/Idh/MocA family oxidoreductase [Kiritimatiellia bacterium]|nr:Gfo/Idh/MocA family oxidoreductase [Kiritimatiellia bacterium]HRU71380.1 Gfo/Idh/MocA family oxidoreductase [Kiritimatiellia bacterium]